ncbi:MAG: hypothetical protein U1F57_09990 [bacterium]
MTPTPVENAFSYTPLRSPPLAAGQQAWDQAVSGFSEEALNPYTLAATVAGGAAFRITRVAGLNFASVMWGGSEFVPSGILARGLGNGLALLGESFVFERTRRSLRGRVTGEGDSLLHWDGEQGFRNGWIQAGFQLAGLRAGSYFSQGQNIFFQHLAGDASLVLSRQALSLLDFSPDSPFDLVRELYSAEAAQIRMRAGMGWVHAAVPQLAAFENVFDAPFWREPNALPELRESPRELPAALPAVYPLLPIVLDQAPLVAGDGADSTITTAGVSSLFQDWARYSLRGSPRASSTEGFSSERPFLTTRDFLRPLVFGSARYEFTRLYRPDGSMARQMVASLGIPPLGRVATRWTLHDVTLFPTALHGEVILGWKPFAVGASVGRSREEIIFSWFRRRQPSILTNNREITRLVVRGSESELQRIGELKLYSNALSITEIGSAVTYQFEREHYLQANRILAAEGPEAAAAFLKQNYPHIDEGLVRRTLARPGRSGFGFVTEIGASVLVSIALRQTLPEGHLLHALETGASYTVSNLFRGGWEGMRPGNIALSVAEGVPLAMTHGLVSMTLDSVENRLQFQTPYRPIVEDFASLAVYGRLRALAFGNSTSVLMRMAPSAELGLGAAELTGGALWASRLARVSLGLGALALVVGGIYLMSRD